MAVNSSLVMRIVSASVAVSNRASQIIRDVMKKGDLGIIEKGKNDFQTEADRSAQRCIVASLHKQFPKVSIYGEEDLGPEKIPADLIELGFTEEVLKHKCPKFLEDVTDDQVVIWVDPLDGTAEYTQGFLDHVTVLIGIAVKGHAVGGVINQPFYNYQDKDKEMGRCIWGVCEVGAFGFTREVLPEKQLILTTSRSHSNRMVTETIEAFEPTEVIRVGGAGHKVLLLIEGKVHAYIFATPGCKKWDTCAPEAILHAVGGTLTDMFGITMSYGPKVKRLNAGGVLATTSNHKFFVSKVPEHVLENLEKSESPEPLPDGVCLRGDNKSCSGEEREEQTVQQEEEEQEQQVEEPSSSPEGNKSPSSDTGSVQDTKL
ncbi:3'(2'),5'-bisphosphate nucleotidase 1-like isoform X3 [Mizuhopecten yessoensis]|uniref:3'(2'),5'-bisphosphate nucleotidase 1 n=1 Tax=Mizuhopecten yessoensis TaxID=6573 RepID=A0A210PQ89_MIZYE|nr:3'(2'),5'-bisphosphate nucleotidase 1-like isoform X3 [Mizuhopecten yessoensis]OWF38632.1 3'(2'),5'-bisphosphate nucleotidase 1 [Mizuhopecten yessoensis]